MTPQTRCDPSRSALAVLEDPAVPLVGRLQQAAEPPRQLQRSSVLVVDDDPDTRAVIACMVESAGLAVLEAPDGATALRLARSEPVSAVILDIVLPDLTGFEVCRRLRDEIERTVPVILVTALSSIMDRDSWVRAGADGYLVKPVRRASLISQLGL